MTEASLYREITAEAFFRERTMRFTPDSPEVTGIRFVTISHEEFERLHKERAPVAVPALRRLREVTIQSFDG